MPYRVDIMTLFPDSVTNVLGESIIGRAAAKGTVEVNCVQIRDFTENRQKQVDDYPYGGGWGVVMNAQPLKSCLDSIMSTAENRKTRVIYMTPQGKPFCQDDARRLRDDYDHLVLVCGHYEGIDERFIELCVDEEISLGDFVLTGGEIAAMAVTDSVLRLVPGVLADEECFTGESHWDGLLEYPQYTRPDVWENMEVPEILRSGDHAKIEKWRREKQLERTKLKRPDLFEKFEATTKMDKKILDKMMEDEKMANTMNFGFRRSKMEDIERLLVLREEAAEYLRGQGVDQWQQSYPNREIFESDIPSERGWVFTHDDEVIGYAAITFEDDEAYKNIDGKWLTDGRYAAIHRCFSAAKYRGTGISKEIFSLGEELALGKGLTAIRIDTHADNKPMQHLVRKNGYSYCGVIMVDGDGNDPHRDAFEKIL